mmetsp:Transcript_16080/g.34002  ORF Transcript_16080/g.34002 Transcript_16080/m.34002 type:complete len:117 (+) Transcript_16080:131-481(+)
MRVLSSITTLAVAGFPLATNAFVSTSSSSATVVTARSSPISIDASAQEDCTTEACDIPSEFNEAPTSLVNVPNGANAIRSAVVTNSAGDFVRIDDAIMKSSTSNAPQIVIYLRHMG